MMYVLCQLLKDVTESSRVFSTFSPPLIAASCFLPDPFCFICQALLALPGPLLFPPGNASCWPHSCLSPIRRELGETSGSRMTSAPIIQRERQNRTLFSGINSPDSQSGRLTTSYCKQNRKQCYCPILNGT